MKRSSVIGTLLFTVLALVPCYAHHLAVIVGKDSQVDSVTSAGLTKLLKAETRKWPDGKTVLVVLHKDSPAQMETLERLSNLSESDLKALFAVHPDSIQLVDSDADLLKIVGTVPGAIGMVDVHSINDKVKVLKVDGKLPLEKGYLPHH